MKLSTYVYFISICIILSACGSTPKRKMQNCKALYLNVFECEDMPEHVKEIR